MTDKPMTQAEALTEAVRRWGPSGWVEISPGSRTSNWGGVHYLVGVNAMDVKGYGDSWEAAFRDADERSR